MAIRLPTGWRRLALFTVAGAVILAALYGVLRLVAFDLTRFAGDGEDMWPGLGKNALVLVNRLATPERGDLIVVNPPGGRPLLRRVVALPGETVASLDGRPFVDGLPDPERHELGRFIADGRELIAWREHLGPWQWTVLDDSRRRLGNTYAKPIDGYWVLADNRDDLRAKDSRALGPIARAHIRGVVSWVLDPGQAPFVGPPGPTAASPLSGGQLESVPTRPPTSPAT